VNSPLKPPQNSTKDGGVTSSIGGRKTSISNQLGSFSATTPNSSSRPSVRRREASDYFGGGPLSPTGNSKFFRDESSTAMPPAALLRRRTDFKDEGADAINDQGEPENNSQSETNSPFGLLRRSATGPLGSGLNASSSSPWGPGTQGSAFGPMGAFGSFAVGTTPSSQEPSEKRPGFGSTRGGSRFKDILAKTTLEEPPSTIKEKDSLGSLGRLQETDVENDESTSAEIKTRPSRSDTNPYGENVPRTGSAPLGGVQESGPQNYGIDPSGFSFGTPGEIGSRDFVHQQQNVQQQTPQPRHRAQEPMSPTNTNPYQSPDGEGPDGAGDDTNVSELHHSAHLRFSSTADESRGTPFGRRGMMSASDDRSQTSSAGPARPFGGLGGSSVSTAWPPGGFGAGTPNRDRPAFSSGFGDQLFGSLTDLQSPSLGSLGGSSFFTSPAIGSTSSDTRPGKLGPLFPPAMQEQMRGDRGKFEGSDALPDRPGEFDGKNIGIGLPESNPQFGFKGSSMYDDSRGASSARHPACGSDDSGAPGEGGGTFPSATVSTSSNIPISMPTSGQNASSTTDNAPQSSHGLSQSSESSSSNQLPATQQRQMVMPDRMRWIYRDPQGNTQGPWSGLEMHDWFKAGFFTADLQVKKVEDAEFEPLAQLVRRIGNSREPFLVPQIGIPHGPPTTSPGNSWAGPVAGGPAGAQPPFANSFPSFGTTLTAEQQNALERRKQEEQYLMARQKEHLAQQQVLMKQMQLQAGPHVLHSLQHHSSAHSLHSQPSFGSITSPSGYQQSPIQGPIQAPQTVAPYFDASVRPGPTSNLGPSIPMGDFRGVRAEDDLPNMVDRVGIGPRGPHPFGHAPNAHDGGPTPQQISAMLQDRARLQMDQQQVDLRSKGGVPADQFADNDRLREFHALRAHGDDLGHHARQNEVSTMQPIGAPIRPGKEHSNKQGEQIAVSSPGDSSQAVSSSTPQDSDNLSLAQQVQKAAAASAQKQITPASEEPWAPPETGLPKHGLPPSVSPLPAPAAQRSRQNVADALAAETRSQTQTPVEAPTSSLAPWADKSTEVAKGPSLKEIQEAEARKAAQQEEIAAAARRAQAAQERAVQANVIAPAPGLPATSNWASATSPATPTVSGNSVWAKAPVGKNGARGAGGGPKKTLAQIQKEEEARKRSRAAAAAQKATSMPTVPGGTRYADLAGKIAPPTPSGPGGAWTTVGSGGKAKAPATVVATPQTVARPTSSVPANTQSTTRTKTAVQPPRNNGNNANQTKAADEFAKWAKGSLAKGLNNNINGKSASYLTWNRP